MELGWSKVQNWNVFFVHRKQGLLLSVYVDDIKMFRKKQSMAPMWKKLTKHVDLDVPSSFLDHVYLGCTQRECKPNDIIVEEYRKNFESLIPSGASAKLPECEKNSHEDGCVVLRYGRTCSKMR